MRSAKSVYSKLFRPYLGCAVAAGLALVVLAGGFIANSSRAATLRQMMSGQETSASKSAWDGVYSDKQAKRGEDLYVDNCLGCHTDHPSNDPGYANPTLIGKSFMEKWDKRSVNELFSYMRTKMPPNSPGSLGNQNYVDVVAYILKANKFPAGKEELGKDEGVLAKITISKAK
jgi:mono/diheme cytochrome c family protein